jgi:hypothetical protein
VIAGKVAVSCWINSTFLKARQFHYAEANVAVTLVSLDVSELGDPLLFKIFNSRRQGTFGILWRAFSVGFFYLLIGKYPHVLILYSCVSLRLFCFDYVAGKR